MGVIKQIIILLCITLTLNVCLCKKSQDENKPEWAKKDIRDYNDADLERLLDQWEVNGVKPVIYIFKQML